MLSLHKQGFSGQVFQVISFMNEGSSGLGVELTLVMQDALV